MPGKKRDREQRNHRLAKVARGSWRTAAEGVAASAPTPSEARHSDIYPRNLSVPGCSRTLDLRPEHLKRTDLDDFVTCYNPKNRRERKETDRFKSFTYEDLIKRDKVNLDIFWLKDESLEDSANLPDPGVIALEITEDLEAALAQFAEIASDLKK